MHVLRANLVVEQCGRASGLVLFHGGQTAKTQQKGRTPNEQWPVVDRAALGRMLMPQAGGQVASGVLTDFQDPEVQEVPQARAGFASVWVRADGKTPRFSGWFVVVCETKQ